MKISEQEYRSAEGFSASEVRAFSSSATPFHFIKRVFENKQTPSMVLGSLCHILALEPERADEFIVVKDDLRRGTQAWKEVEKRGKKIVKESEWNKASLMARNVREHPLLKPIFDQGGESETSIFWEDDDGHKCKARLDFYSDKLGLILDLKSTLDANPINPFGFAKSVKGYRYDLQAAHYIESIRSITKIDPDFLFAAVDNDAPYSVSVSTLSQNDLEAAHDELKVLKQKLSEHRKSNVWPSWENKIFTLLMPKGASYG